MREDLVKRMGQTKPTERSYHTAKHGLQPPHALLVQESNRRATAPYTNGSGHAARETAHWDENLRELTFRGQLVKRFRQPADSQTTVLSEFERRGWPTRIDNPLPHRVGLKRKQHLRDTIKNLNRHQRFPCIVFFADGTGQGIGWRLRIHKSTATPKLPRKTC